MDSIPVRVETRRGNALAGKATGEGFEIQLRVNGGKVIAVVPWDVLDRARQRAEVDKPRAAHVQ